MINEKNNIKKEKLDQKKKFEDSVVNLQKINIDEVSNYKKEFKEIYNKLKQEDLNIHKEEVDNLKIKIKKSSILKIEESDIDLLFNKITNNDQ